MGSPDFRVVGNETPSRSNRRRPAATVPLTLGELIPLLARAKDGKLGWLNDLAGDPILVTADLAEILSRYRQILNEKSA